MAEKNGAAFGWHRMSLSQFAAVLAAPLLATRGLVALGDLGIQAICARVIHRLGVEAALGRYANIAEGPGFAQALGQVVTELRLAKLDAAAIRVVAPDLVPLFEAYESDLAEGGFLDWAGLVTTASDALASDDFTHRLITLPTIMLDVRATHEAELNFVRALSLRIPELLFLAPKADERTLARVAEVLHTPVDNNGDYERPINRSIKRLSCAISRSIVGQSVRPSSLALCSRRSRTVMRGT
jgi:hypothetical protein